MNDEYDPTRPFQSGDADSDLEWEDDEGSPKLLWGRVLALAGILLLAFLLGRATGPDDAGEEVAELREQLSDANDTIDDLEAVLETITPASPAPTIDETPTDGEPTDGEPEEPEGRVKSYTVKEGDTFNSIAEDEFGEATPGNVDCLVEANGGDDVISPGDQIDIPEDCADE